METESKFTKTIKELHEMLSSSVITIDDIQACDQELNAVILRLLATRGLFLSLETHARSYDLTGSIHGSPSGKWSATVTLEPGYPINTNKNMYANRTFYCL